MLVVEDEIRPRPRLFERGEQRIVFRKAGAPQLRLRRHPLEIHAHPAEARRANHLQFARLRIGETDVHPEPVERARCRQVRMHLRTGNKRSGKDEDQRANAGKDVISDRVSASPCGKKATMTHIRFTDHFFHRALSPVARS